MEDFLDDFSDDWENFRSEQDVKASTRPFYNAGYREGAERGKENEAALQLGFDFGIQTTVSPSYMFGLLKGYIIIATQVIKYLEGSQKDTPPTTSGSPAYDFFLQSGGDILQQLHNDLQLIETYDRTGALTELARHHVESHSHADPKAEGLDSPQTETIPTSTQSQPSSDHETDAEDVDPLLNEDEVSYFIRHSTPEIVGLYKQRLQSTVDLFAQLGDTARAASEHAVQQTSLPRGSAFLSAPGLLSLCQEALSMFDKIQSYL